eukprot:TRINITY_DN5411_c0_g2_i2.p1 TRINITY_DN5411_c0_g2~~TRINITY_DN5411_c0_g2_i2.p1  ORF type:complete len:424 (-),score=97.23 TRINITY_DN5411_c0_g2_i2:773-2020(-)
MAKPIQLSQPVDITVEMLLFGSVQQASVLHRYNNKKHSLKIGHLRYRLNRTTTTCTANEQKQPESPTKKYSDFINQLAQKINPNNNNGQNSNQNQNSNNNVPKQELSDWSMPTEDDDEWAPNTEDDSSFRRKYGKKDPRDFIDTFKQTPEDEFLRPIISVKGAYRRLYPDQEKTEDELLTEFEANQFESRESLKFAVIYLIVIPLSTGFIISRGLAGTVLDYVREVEPQAFEPTSKQKAHGAEEIHKEEMRLRMEAAVGIAPPLEEDEMMLNLHETALEIREEIREENQTGLINLISDSISATVLFIGLLKKDEGRQQFFRTIGRIASGLSDTSKAFLVILVADILLGYHSEEGWTAAINLFTEHYGQEVEEESIVIFVGIVPVVLDTFFKLWIFRGLTKISPSAAVTLKEMDRH